MMLLGFLLLCVYLYAPVTFTDDPPGDVTVDFGDALVGIGKDARLILSRELRHSILKLATEKRPAAPK